MKTSFKVIFCLVVPLLLISANVGAQNQRAAAATTAFREARDLIGDGEWAKAETAFTRFISAFPQDRDVPAALYWLAFSQKQQSKFQPADTVLNGLIRGYPSSTWLNDARALQVEIAPRLRNSQVIEQGTRDPDDEIRLTALQSLFESRPERALPMAAEILKQGSNASRLLKEGAVSLLGDAETTDAIPLLVQVARNDADMRLRRKAVEALGEIESTATLEPLKSLALQSSDLGVARSAVNALEEQEGPARKTLLEIARSNAGMEVREEAIGALGEIEDEPAVVEDLVAIMGGLREPRLQAAVLAALGEIELAQAEMALSEIARTASILDLRKQAIKALSEHQTESAGESLARLYDAEKDEATKEVIIAALEETESRAALRKVTQIAAQETSTRLRRLALSAIEELEDALK
jgi:HEAT repeat protein